MIDISPLLHAAVALGLQIVIGVVFGDWVMGGAIGCVWFIAREHTQAEYRWIVLFGKGKRSNMPWWGGFDYLVWDLASVLDFAVPIAAVAVVWMIVRQ